MVVPTRNRSHLVGRALRSILAQTIVDFEVVVVDDGSTDETPQVLAGFVDPRVRILRLEKNGGVSRARNTAIGAATGEWIAFLDDDNEWQPSYLERQLEVAGSRPVTDVVYCRAWQHDERSGRGGVMPLPIPRGPTFRELVNGWQPATSCTMVRRSRLVALGSFDEGLRVAEDYDLWLRLAQHAEFAGSREVLVIRHEHRGEHLFHNTELHAQAVAVLERRWSPVIEARCGRKTARRWRARLVANVGFSGVVRAAEARHHREAFRHAGELVRLLPWSAPYLVRAAGIIVLGPRRYRRLALTRVRRRPDGDPPRPTP